MKSMKIAALLMISCVFCVSGLCANSSIWTKIKDFKDLKLMENSNGKFALGANIEGKDPATGIPRQMGLNKGLYRNIAQLQFWHHSYLRGKEYQN